jgi:virulence-associated protein VagC
MVPIQIKTNFLFQKYIDIIVIKNKGLDYYQIYQEKNEVKIKKFHRLEVDIYENGVLKLINLDSALTSIINNFKIKELGILIDLPSIIFQKINISKTSQIKDSIINYLKVNFPLPIENYSLYYKEEGFKPIGSLSNFSLFLVEKDLIERIVATTKKLGIFPLFVTLQFEVFLQYLIKSALIEFNQDYLVFFVSENNLLTFTISNFSIQKLIIEDYNHEKIDISSIISRIYNFFKKDLKENSKIIVLAKFKKEELNLEEKIKQPITYIEISPEKIFIEGSYSIFNSILQDKEIIDFLPLKNYYAYFFNRIPKIVTFLSVYLLFLSIFTSLFFLPFYLKFNKEVKILKEKNKNLTIRPLSKENLESFLKLKDELKKETFIKFSQIKDIINIDGFENLNFQGENLIFSFKVKKDETNDFKYKISKKFPQAKIIEENITENEVNLKYSF